MSTTVEPTFGQAASIEPVPVAPVPIDSLPVEPDAVARLRVVLARGGKLLERQASGTDGLTPTQMSVLGAIVRSGPIGVSELAEAEGVNPTMLSRVIGKLDDAGLIRRNADPGDRRAARIEATGAGTGLHERHRTERTRLLTDRLSALGATHRAELVRALPALEALIEELARPAVTARR